jgi:Ni/Co efflux regulator RcnB
MKKCIQVAVCCIFATILSAGVVAQSMSDEQKNEAKARYQAYKEKLHLNEDQSKKVDAINTTYFEGISELKKSNASKLSKYKKFKSLNAERDKSMKEVLTKEQYKIYKEQQEERKEEFKHRRANRE